MNWKIIVGILLIYGAVSEIPHITENATTGNFSPVPLYLFIAAMIVGSLFLINKGWKERKSR